MNRRFEAEEKPPATRCIRWWCWLRDVKANIGGTNATRGRVYKGIRWECKAIQCDKGSTDECIETRYEKQDEAHRFQMPQMEVIIQQQSEQIRAQQLQTESMNMQMKKLMDSIRPLADPLFRQPLWSPHRQPRWRFPHLWRGLHQPVIKSQGHQVPQSPFLP